MQIRLTMNLNPLLLTIILSLLFAFINCTTKTSKTNEEKLLAKPDASINDEQSSPVFKTPKVPLMITDPQERAIYLSRHYWDLFLFNDTTLISQPDITEQGFVDYIQLLNHISYPNAESSIGITMDKAKVDIAMYNYFVSLFEKYFYDPNSPFRNDELYIPVVANALKSGFLPDVKKDLYDFQQEMILKNRVGAKATDFIYTIVNGDKKSMHDMKTDYLILFFTNPDCPTCKTVIHEMDNSTTLKNIFSLNSTNKRMLTVLSVYPDSNIDEWRISLPNMPQQNWVNAYDDGTIITNRRLYDIKAIPTLYLLDKSKRIILKDTSLEEIENYFMKVR